MRIARTLQTLGTLTLLAAGTLAIGCKSAPELTESQAQALIQASYDQTDPVGASVVVNDLGMREGVTAKYWTRTKAYPILYWADFTLTPDGKKALKLPDGGDVIQWRPNSPTDSKFSITVITLAANHLKAHDVSNIQDEILPGVQTAKGADFIEGVNLDGVPSPLQNIAHNPGNKLSKRRHADFSFEGGSWKLHGIV
ncbi:MAG: hypothetical protein ABSF28_18795 [Terracidiphilus sp.]|jgi:hypothetical protein